MDAIALLKKDHMTVKRLFDRFEKARSGKKEIADKILKELAIHSAVEEQLFYPAARLKAKRNELEEADDQVLEALEEHHVAKWLLAEAVTQPVVARVRGVAVRTQVAVCHDREAYRERQHGRYARRVGW